MSQTQTQLPPDSQYQRWLKYGGNVLLVSVVAIALVGFLIYLADKKDKRIDTTIGGSQSLRPQTVDFLKKLDKKVRIVAVYPQLKSDDSHHGQDYYSSVSDLLSEFAAQNPNISTQMIDPDKEKDQFNKLVANVTNTYGGEAKDYKAIIDGIKAQSDDANKFAAAELTKFRALPLDKVTDEGLQRQLMAAQLTLANVPQILSQMKESVDSDLDQQIPSYKDAVGDIASAFTDISKYMTLYSELMESWKSNPDVPAEIKAYAPDAQKRATDAAKPLNDLLDKIGKLPALTELQEFKNTLKTQSIIIMSDNKVASASTEPTTQQDANSPGYKILTFNDVWKVPETSRFAENNDASQQRMTFTAEQQITSRIASLTSGRHPMVVFVRSGGSPLTTLGQDGNPGPFMALAERLREYNFDPEDKDGSGQPQQQEMPSQEPTEDQMASAIWVVVPSPPNPMMGPSPISGMLSKHLADGGSALVLTQPTGDSMGDVLSAWGIVASPQLMMVKDVVTNSGGRQVTDMIQRATQENPVVFLLDHYGDTPMVKPLEGLGMLTYFASPVSVMTSPPPGVSAWPLLPFPLEPHSWGSTTAGDIYMHGGTGKALFNSKVDTDNTEGKRLYGAAQAEKVGGGRIVVVGSPYFATSDIITMPDPNHPGIARLPGNGEFFMNAIFWLAHMDNMLAISPHALETARIKDISSNTLDFWKFGVLTAGLPLLVVLAGMMTYLKRRD